MWLTSISAIAVLFGEARTLLIKGSGRTKVVYFTVLIIGIVLTAIGELDMKREIISCLSKFMEWSRG